MNNFLVQTLMGSALRTMPAALKSARECARLRTTMIEAAWPWLRHQPGSALSRWFQEPLRRSNHFDASGAAGLELGETFAQRLASACEGRLFGGGYVD